MNLYSEIIVLANDIHDSIDGLFSEHDSNDLLERSIKQRAKRIIELLQNKISFECSLCHTDSDKIKYHQGECTDPTTNIKEDLIICDVCYKELERDAQDIEDLNNSLPWVIQKIQ